MQYRQLLGLALALVTVAAAALVLFLQGGNAPPETALVLSQTAIPLPGEAAFENGRYTVELQAISGDTELVRVRVTGPGGSVEEWDQGLERKSYDDESGRYFIDILSIMDDKTSATDVTVSVSRQL